MSFQRNSKWTVNISWWYLVRIGSLWIVPQQHQEVEILFFSPSKHVCDGAKFHTSCCQTLKSEIQIFFLYLQKGLKKCKKTTQRITSHRRYASLHKKLQLRCTALLKKSQNKTDVIDHSKKSQLCRTLQNSVPKKEQKSTEQQHNSLRFAGHADPATRANENLRLTTKMYSNTMECLGLRIRSQFSVTNSNRAQAHNTYRHVHWHMHMLV